MPNTAWKEHAYPLRRITIQLQGTRRSELTDIINQLDEVKEKPFGYEDWLPLAPGKYKVEFSLTNLLGETSYTAERDIVMPNAPSEGFELTEVVPFSDIAQIDPATSEVLPFSSGGVKFTPYAGKELALVPGQDLKVFYQIWSVPAAPSANAGKKLLADYAYGRPGITGTAKSIHDEAAKEQFDESGSMVSGKKLSTLDLEPGILSKSTARNPYQDDEKNCEGKKIL